VVILQNCIDFQNSEHGCHSGMCATSYEVGIEVIHVQIDGVTDVTDREPMTSSLRRTDPGVGFMSLECLPCFMGIQNWLSVH
jgi:hypothetical protein